MLAFMRHAPTVAVLLLLSPLALAQSTPGAGVPVLPPIEKGFPTSEPGPTTEPVGTPAPSPAPVETAPPAALAPVEAPRTPAPPPAESVEAAATVAPATAASAPTAASPAGSEPVESPPAVEPPVPDAFAPREPAHVRYAPGRGFQVLTDDGDFELSLGLWAQLRYGYRPVPGDNRQLLSIPRARLHLSGHFFGPHHRYLLMLGFSPDDVARRPAPVVGLPEPAVDTRGARADLATGTDVVQQSPLLDLFFDFTHERDFSLRAGQYRLPFTRQRMIPDGKRQFMERALADQEFQLDRDVGVLLFSDDLGGLDMLRYSAGVSIGEGRNPSSQSIGVGDRGLLYLARFEVLPVGRFDVSTETDFTRASEARIVFGAAYALLQADATSPYGARFLGRALGGAEETAIVDFNAHNFTTDVRWPRGLSRPSMR